VVLKEKKGRLGIGQGYFEDHPFSIRDFAKVGPKADGFQIGGVSPIGFLLYGLSPER